MAQGVVSSRCLAAFFVFAVTFFANPLIRAEHTVATPEQPVWSEIADYENRHRLGHHLVIDLFGCNKEKIKHVDFVEKTMIAAAHAAKATIVSHHFHQFQPIGVSGAVILAESHIAIHTWPEVGYIAADIFTCGENDNFAALEVLKAGFEAESSLVVDIDRGVQSHSLERVRDSMQLFREELDPLKGFRTTITVNGKPDSVKSDFQRIDVYDTNAVGKMMAIDGIIQLTSYDNACYHEMGAHVPLQALPDARKVLIIGGGEGGMLTELVKYSQLEEIVVCDIDFMVRQMSEKHFPELTAAYNDPRVRAVYQDGTVFVKNFKNYFDLIIVDSTDFFGPAAGLNRSDFYEDLAQAVKDDGVVTAQAESMFYDRDFIKGFVAQTKAIFPLVTYYHVNVPTYPSGTIGFLFASKKYGPLDNLGKNTQDLGQLQYYTHDIHRASFVLPAFLSRMLEQ